MYNLGSRSALCAELWAGTETALGARLPRKEVFQQPLILDFGLIAAMQCKTNNCFIPFLLCLKPSFVYIVYKILEW
jgi:hypothetical protein